MKKIKILIMGLPGSGKTTLSEKLAPLLDAVRVNADEVRKEANDWDFSHEGRLRQAIRMSEKSNKILEEGKHVVADFVCPTKKTREDFGPDYIIWMNTISKGRFDDTNKMFEKPVDQEVNYIVTSKNAEEHKSKIAKEINNYIKKMSFSN